MAENEREQCAGAHHVMAEGADRCQCGAAVKVGTLADLMKETKAEYLASGSADPVVITSL